MEKAKYSLMVSDNEKDSLSLVVEFNRDKENSKQFQMKTKLTDFSQKNNFEIDLYKNIISNTIKNFDKKNAVPRVSHPLSNQVILEIKAKNDDIILSFISRDTGDTILTINAKEYYDFITFSSMIEKFLPM
jgi:hypothetical protein